MQFRGSRFWKLDVGVVCSIGGTYCAPCWGEGVSSLCVQLLPSEVVATSYNFTYRTDKLKSEAEKWTAVCHSLS
jgi:hypothetical protein